MSLLLLFFFLLSSSTLCRRNGPNKISHNYTCINVIIRRNWSKLMKATIYCQCCRCHRHSHRFPFYRAKNIIQNVCLSKTACKVFRWIFAFTENTKEWRWKYRCCCCCCYFHTFSFYPCYSRQWTIHNAIHKPYRIVAKINVCLMLVVCTVHARSA